MNLFKKLKIGEHEVDLASFRCEFNPRAKKLVYISHPSSGLEENTLDIEKIIRRLYKEDDIYENYCLVSPVHNFGFMYKDTEYERGLSYCTDLLYFCDEMWVFGNWMSSKGCNKEVEVANKLGIKTRFLGNSSDLDDVISNKTYKTDSYIDTPSKSRKIIRNQKAFVCITTNELEKYKNNLEFVLCKKILFGDIQSALDKVKDNMDKETYVMLEVELRGNDILDLDDKDVADQMKKLADMTSDTDEKELVRKFATLNGKSAIKRVVKGKDKVIKNGVITLNNREVYNIFWKYAIKDIKVYSNYSLNSGKSSFIFSKSI